jgi:hypothetical protein
MLTSNETYTLLGPDGKPYASSMLGAFGGHHRSKLYGRLDCRSALQAIAGGGYVEHRVFFAGEATASAAGYRPCAVCMPQEYATVSICVTYSGAAWACHLSNIERASGQRM